MKINKKFLIISAIILLVGILSAGYAWFKVDSKKLVKNNPVLVEKSAETNNDMVSNDISTSPSSISSDVNYSDFPLVVVALIPAALDFSTSSISDPSTFKPLNSYWAKDKDYVYLLSSSENNGTTTKIVQDAVAESFQIIKDYGYYEGYAKDKNHVYYRVNNSYSVVDGADLATFQALIYGSAKDKNNVYLSYNYGGSRDPIVVIIKGADVETFQMIGDYYAKDKNYVYYTGAYGKVEIIINADPNTFKLADNGHYATDKNYVFINATISFLDGADPDTFKELDDHWFIDKNNVYYTEYISGTNVAKIKIVQGADPDTFEFDKTRIYQKDKNYIYNYNSDIIVGADAATFETLNSGWYKDKNQIYFFDNSRHFQVFQTADFTTFQVIAVDCVVGYSCYDYYAEDKNNIFYAGRIISGADHKTFKPLENGLYAKDKNNVYVGGENAEGFDAASFQTIAGGEFFIKDKNNVYVAGDFLSLGNMQFDSKTFKHLDGSYFGDKNKIICLFFGGGAYQIESVTADLNTFQVIGGGFAKDKNHVFYLGGVITKADPKTFKISSKKDSFGGENIIDKNYSYRCAVFEMCGKGCYITDLKTGKRAWYNTDSSQPSDCD